jgi:hypothetical protein
MSHSQFHSTNLFILRHAWLNLWDKHMTTGRINQVTVHTKTHGPVEIQRATASRHHKRLSRLELFPWLLIRPCPDVALFLCTVTCAVLCADISRQTSLVSDSHKFRPSSPCPETEMDVQHEDYTEWDIAIKQAHTQVFLQMIRCTTLAIGK